MPDEAVPQRQESLFDLFVPKDVEFGW